MQAILGLVCDRQCNNYPETTASLLPPLVRQSPPPSWEQWPVNETFLQDKHAKTAATSEVAVVGVVKLTRTGDCLPYSTPDIT